MTGNKKGQPPTHAGVSGALGLGHSDVLEENPQLSTQQAHISTTEDFGHKHTTRPQDKGCDGESGHNQLGLDVLVQVVQPRHCQQEMEEPYPCKSRTKYTRSWEHKEGGVHHQVLHRIQLNLQGRHGNEK